MRDHKAALMEIQGILGACVSQRAASDDKIIADHIEEAYKIALDALHGPDLASRMAKHNEDVLRFVMFGERP
jgi:hypothetical protein